MNVFLLSILVMLTASCSNQAQRAVYDMMHEKQRQDCLKRGQTDCPKQESYDKYKQQRDEVMQHENMN